MGPALGQNHMNQLFVPIFFRTVGGFGFIDIDRFAFCVSSVSFWLSASSLFQLKK